MLFAFTADYNREHDFVAMCDGRYISVTDVPEDGSSKTENLSKAQSKTAIFN